MVLVLLAAGLPTPPVCLDADHSGPYAASIGGAKYSELFFDRGSQYLWGYRMAKKTGHYLALPLVLADAQALSGRPVQIFHSDGDGVFTSEKTEKILLDAKIRHEFSAPYDSNTNPFVERARRTVYEGVCTALLRANAPARFWGEAECHKIFTINVLPTIPDPENEGKFISRLNLLTGNMRTFNLNRLQAFGTLTTCYLPPKARVGGKHPAQRRSFQGAILGYEDGSPSYRIWDLEAKKIRVVSYNFTVVHEGYFPFREKRHWPEDCFEDPTTFSPGNGGSINSTRRILRKFFLRHLALLWTDLMICLLVCVSLRPPPCRPLNPSLLCWMKKVKGAPPPPPPSSMSGLTDYKTFGGTKWLKIWPEVCPHLLLCPPLPLT